MKSTPTAAYALLVLFGGLLMLLGVVAQGDLAQHALFLAFGLISLLAAGALRIRT